MKSTKQGIRLHSDLKWMLYNRNWHAAKFFVDPHKKWEELETTRTVLIDQALGGLAWWDDNKAAYKNTAKQYNRNQQHIWR